MKTKSTAILLASSLAFLPGALAQTNALAAGGPTRVACVGDSITVGVASREPYPKQLQALLGPQWQVENFGTSGRTLLKKGDHPYWREHTFIAAHAFQPNVVIIMLGTNDTKPQNWVHHDEFAADYKELVETFKSLPSHPRIFLCRPCPVFNGGKWGINEPDIQLEIPLIDQVAKEEGAGIIDMHAALDGHPEVSPRDGVHPDADGDALMARAAAAALTAAP